MIAQAFSSPSVFGLLVVGFLVIGGAILAFVFRCK